MRAPTLLDRFRRMLVPPGRPADAYSACPRPARTQRPSSPPCSPGSTTSTRRRRASRPTAAKTRSASARRPSARPLRSSRGRASRPRRSVRERPRRAGGGGRARRAGTRDARREVARLRASASKRSTSWSRRSWSACGVQPLTPGWVAVSVRARLLLARRLGRGPARELAALRVARGRAGAPRRQRLRSRAGSRDGPRRARSAPSPRRCSGTCACWRLGAAGAVEPLRALAGLVRARQRRGPPRLHRGRAAAGRRSSSAGSRPRRGASPARSALADLRAALAATVWGDPGGDDPAAIRLGLRLGWARRVIGAVEEAAGWAAGAVALLLARELAPRRASRERAARSRAAGESGPTGPARRASLRCGRSLPPTPRGRWRGSTSPRSCGAPRPRGGAPVEVEAEHLAQAHLGRPAVIGAVTLLGVDGRRTAAALEVAARGGDLGALEVFERGCLSCRVPARMSRVAIVAPRSRLRATLRGAGRRRRRRAGGAAARRRTASRSRRCGGSSAPAPEPSPAPPRITAEAPDVAALERAGRRDLLAGEVAARAPRRGRASSAAASPRSWPGCRAGELPALAERLAAVGGAVVELRAAARSSSRRRCCAPAARAPALPRRSSTPTARRATRTSTRRRSPPPRSCSCSG